MKCRMMEGLRRQLSRRSFLSRAVAAGTFVLTGTGARPLSAGFRLTHAEVGDFKEVADPRFELIVPGSTSRELVLAEVRVPPPDPARPRFGVRREPFSLLFTEATADTLPQGVYRLRHRALGTFDLLLVPVGPFPDGCRYEVVFN